MRMSIKNKPENMDETPICLDDIRNKLSDIDDKTLALDILDNLDKLENQLADKTAIITKMTKRESDLLDQNNKLFARVTQINEVPKVLPGVDYSGIDRENADIIDRI